MLMASSIIILFHVTFDLLKLHRLLDPQGVFGGEGAQIPHGHQGTGVAQVDLQGLRVAGLPQSLDGIRVAQKVRIHLLGDAGLLRRFLQNLPGPLAGDAKYRLVESQVLVKGMALKAVGQGVRAGHHPGLPALADDMEDTVPLMGADPPRGQAQGLRDPQPRLKQGVDKQPVSFLVPPLAGPGHGLHLCGGEEGDDLQGPGEQGRNRGVILQGAYLCLPADYVGA